MSTRKLLPTIAALALAAGMAAPAVRADTPSAGHDRPVVAGAKADQGNVWVNLYLTRHRLEDSFIPVVFGVRNASRASIDLRRSSFTLVMPDGTKVAAADVAALRSDYPKLEYDARWLHDFGVTKVLDAWGVYYLPSNFYPSLTFRNGVEIPLVQLPQEYWTAGVIYFPRPPQLKAGSTVTLQVHPEGWTEPVAVTVTL